MIIPDKIIPAILSKNPEAFQKDLSKLLNSKNLNSGWLHVDFMDNIFVPNLSVTPEDLSGIGFGLLKKEAHLMVAEPQEWIPKLIKDGYKRIIIHVEIEGNIHDYISEIKAAGCEAVLAINPHTPISKIEPYAGEIDGILVMGVVPGFQGQEFIPETLDKIKEIRTKGWSLQISVDGAVKDWNAKNMMESGADILIVGSFLIKGDPDSNLSAIMRALYAYG